MEQTNSPQNKTLAYWSAAVFLIVVIIVVILLVQLGQPAVGEDIALSPLPTPTVVVIVPSPTPTPLPPPLELVVLHTNDTWGYLSPCG